MARIISIANQKGGVGKTTTAVNLAAFIAMEGNRTLIIDSDPQGNASSGLGINRRRLKYCYYDILLNSISYEKVLCHTSLKGLDIIPATIQLAGAEIELASLDEREFRLKQAIDGLEKKYDYIFIDCPPSLGLLTINALVASQEVIIPMQCEYYAMEGLSQLVDTINLIRKKLNASLKITGILFTMFDGRTNLSIQVVDEVKKHFRKEVYTTIIPRNIRLSEAPSHGKPIAVYDPRSRGAEFYRDLAKEVKERE
jgi:chromosome partitioning protein